MNTARLICLLILAAGTGWAQGKKPARDEPKKEGNSGLKKAESETNKALDNVEKVVKESARDAKKGGNKALQALDDTIHGRK